MTSSAIRSTRRGAQGAILLALAAILVACGSSGGGETADATGALDVPLAPDLGGSGVDATAGDATADVAPDVPMDDVAAPVCPPAPPAPGEVRARRIACAEEQLGGSLALGGEGDILLENARVRVVVRATGEGHGLPGLYAGGVLDAARRGAPADGLRELQTLISLNALETTSVEIGDDGSASSEAVAVVTGRPLPLPIVARVLPPFPVEAAIVQEIVLRPDEDYVTLRVRVSADEAGGPAQVLLVDLLFLGGEQPLFRPGTGMGDEESYTGPYLATEGRGASSETSYGYVGGATMTMIDLTGSQMIMHPSRVARPGEELVMERYFLIGDGSASSVTALAHPLRGEATARVEGQVRFAHEGGPVGAGCHVTLADDADRVLTRARTDDGGDFVAELPPGALRLHATCPGGHDGPTAELELTAAGAFDVALDAEAPSAIEAVVRDEHGVPMPARVTLFDLDAPAARPRQLLVSPTGSIHPVRSGRYRAVASRGPEFTLHEVAELPLSPGETFLFEAQLARVVETPGMVAAEFHLHSEYSADAAVPLAERILSCAVEGLELVVATDHDFITDYAPVAAAQGLDAFLKTVVGCEISSVDAGHFNAWPLTLQPELAGNGAPRWFELSPGELAREIRALTPGGVVQVNHPRFQNESTFDLIDFDPADGLAHADPVALGFSADTDLNDLDEIDAYEVYNGIGDEELEEQLRDWYGLLNHGKRLTATAGGDSHELSHLPGYPRNFVFVDEDDPATLDPTAVDAAVRAMRVVVSTGPVIEATLTDPATGATATLGETLTASEGAVELHVRVRAAPWLDVDELSVVVGGEERLTEVIPPADPPGVVRLDRHITLPAAEDTWFVVIVRGPRGDRQWTPQAPFALTNPIFVEVAR